MADLLAAETASQRRSALVAADGVVSRRIAGWRSRLLSVAAGIEAAIDYSDEDDVGAGTVEEAFRQAEALRVEMAELLERPAAERMRDGVRVVVAGPPNSGKSSLINALAGRDIAIESAIPGTTRDLIEVPIALGGVPIVLVDTAGLRDAADEIEAIGVARALQATRSADIVLWLGDDDPPLVDAVLAIHSRADARAPHPTRLSVSARTGMNLTKLADQIRARANLLLPGEDAIALNQRQRRLAREITDALGMLRREEDLLLAAENVRLALSACERLSGRAGVEEMLDGLFARFCIGK